MLWLKKGQLHLRWVVRVVICQNKSNYCLTRPNSIRISAKIIDFFLRWLVKKQKQHQKYRRESLRWDQAFHEVLVLIIQITTKQNACMSLAAFYTQYFKICCRFREILVAAAAHLSSQTILPIPICCTRVHWTFPLKVFCTQKHLTLYLALVIVEQTVLFHSWK